MHEKKNYTALFVLIFTFFTWFHAGQVHGTEDIRPSPKAPAKQGAAGDSVFPSRHRCTVIVASDDQQVLAGNNEDWSDSNTWFWMIPATGGKHGWIKFGFAGGFPQGGMNDQGVFWDATGCAYLEMPFSESTKIKFPGPLMQKVMEECGSTREALQIFENYYCDDQYNAQYLIGDAAGVSAIVEGDEVVPRQGTFQVATNFYQTHPELGGFPCKRYDTAVAMLENSGEMTVSFMGEVLSHTHQEGKYPTQYSNIYDLKRGIIYLFHYHHYEEYLPIDLKMELQKGQRAYPMAGLFSKITPGLPSQNETIAGTKAKFTWTGKRNSHYQLVYSTEATFAGSHRLPVIKQHSRLFDKGFAGILLLGVITAGGVLRRNRKRFAILAILMGISFFTLLCHLDEHVNPTGNPVEDFQLVVDHLKPHTTYYWKIVARTEGTHDFQTESIPRVFRTGP